ncbi:MAG: NAD-dependent malic enzyme [Sedimentisphaerales bacterium]|nr:NAD-dependent malic enzyme [Sedimentisphaerales bacterium]
MIETRPVTPPPDPSASHVYTLRCRIADAPDISQKLSAAIAAVPGHLGAVAPVPELPDPQIRDITIYLYDKNRFETLKNAVVAIAGVEIIAITDEVLEIHRRGAIDIVSRAPLRTQLDLRMVYTPGVASVCQEIEKNPDLAWQYTGICDRVAIVTNGTAILGLGDIGPLAGLPVMEGKAAIMAEFVQISGVPILIDTKDPDAFVDTVLAIASGFGAIQLEDVAAPQCFEIEEKLISKLNIPVFHDDQHGTATIVLAAVSSALRQTAKAPQDCSALVLGAGAAGCAVSKLLLEYGIGDIVLYDSKGPIYEGRKEAMNPYKHQMARITNKKNQKCSFPEAFTGKDIFIGLSRPNMVTQDMIRAMNPDPIVFPLSNPVGEISKAQALEAGAAITADGRDINNALAYPGIFRGALDARAAEINLAMKIAAAEQIASLAPENQLLPDILDRKVHRRVADAVADAWRKQHS